MRVDEFVVRQGHIYFLLLLLATTSGCSLHWSASWMQAENTKVRVVEANETGLDSLFIPYRKFLDSAMQIPVGMLGERLEKKGINGSLGFFITDAMLTIARQSVQHPVDGCVMNAGGIRLPELPAGLISTGKLYELLPFDNQLTLVELRGIEFRDFLRHSLSSGGWPISGIDLQAEDSSRLYIQIAGKALVDTQVYQIVVPDYLANGGDRCSMLENKPRRSLNILLRDAVIQYWGSQPTQSPLFLQDPKIRIRQP